MEYVYCVFQLLLVWYYYLHKVSIMKANMGKVDRVIRILVAIVISYLYYSGVLSGTVAIVLGILAVIFVATSFISFCPLYLPFGLSTRKKD